VSKQQQPHIKIVAKSNNQVEAYKDGALVETWTEDNLAPLDEGKSLMDLVKLTIYNVDQVPAARQQRFALWLKGQEASVRDLAELRPPNRLYRVKGDIRGTQHGFSPLGIVVGYRAGERGGPAEALCMFLGIKAGPGSMEAPARVIAEGLEDVTQEARQDINRPRAERTLPELRDPFAD